MSYFFTRHVWCPPLLHGLSFGLFMAEVTSPHLPQYHNFDVVLLFAAHRCPPPLLHIPTSGLFTPLVINPHFVHFQIPISSLPNYFTAR
jgi:hypothetical protein